MMIRPRLAWMASLAIGVLVTVGCATTNIRSQLDPQARGRVYSTLMVQVDFKDLGLRQDAETQFQALLSARGTKVLRSIDLLFPGRTHSAEEIAAVLRNANVEAILVASSSSSGTSSTWIPPTTTTEGSATVVGNRVSGRSTTSTNGGYSVSKPWAAFEARLYDATSGQVVWLASMSSGGNAFADWGDLAKSMAKKASEQLTKDGVIR